MTAELHNLNRERAKRTVQSEDQRVNDLELELGQLLHVYSDIGQSRLAEVLSGGMSMVMHGIYGKKE